MIILAVDTSSGHPSAVVMRGGSVIAEVSDGSNLHYSDALYPALERLLDESGIALEEVDAFGAVRGPGSFTGIRVGLAAMEGLAFARKRPARGVSALAAIAWLHPPGSARIVPLLDARRGKFYGGVYRRDHGRVTMTGPEAVREASEWLAAAEPGTVFSGPGASALAGQIERVRGVSVRPVSPILARAAASLIDAGHGEPMIPLYLEKTRAEENREPRVPTPDLAGAGETDR